MPSFPSTGFAVLFRAMKAVRFSSVGADVVAPVASRPWLVVTTTSQFARVGGPALGDGSLQRADGLVDVVQGSGVSVALQACVKGSGGRRAVLREDDVVARLHELHAVLRDARIGLGAVDQRVEIARLLVRLEQRGQHGRADGRAQVRVVPAALAAPRT